MRRRTGAQKNYILGHFSATICCYYQNVGIYLRGKEYIKVVGIPLGKQCFKFARLSAAPFGRDIRFGGGAPSFIANILWIILLGWENAVYCAAMGIVCCCTIIGIPLGLQYFKFAKLAFMPFGSEVVDC